MIRVLLLFFCLVLCASGCGQSPVLNHTDSPNSTSSGVAPNAMAADPGSCDLIFPKAGLCASLSWARTPKVMRSESFTLRLWPQPGTHASAEGIKDISIDLWMPDMGHGSFPVQITKNQPGIFEVTQAYFNMPGQWDIRIQVKEGKNFTDEAVETIAIH